MTLICLCYVLSTKVLINFYLYVNSKDCLPYLVNSWRQWSRQPAIWPLGDTTTLTLCAAVSIPTYICSLSNYFFVWCFSGLASEKKYLKCGNNGWVGLYLKTVSGTIIAGNDLGNHTVMILSRVWSKHTCFVLSKCSILLNPVLLKLPCNVSNHVHKPTI